MHHKQNPSGSFVINHENGMASRQQIPASMLKHKAQSSSQINLNNPSSGHSKSGTHGFANPKSQRAANPASKGMSQPGSSKEAAVANSIEFKSFQHQNFNSRQSLSNNIQNITPIGQLAQGAISHQHGSAAMRQSMNSSSNNVKYNKENLGGNPRMTPSQNFMNQGRTSQQQMAMLNHNQPHHGNQLSQQFNTSSSKGDDPMLRQQLPMTLLNKTTSFLSAATTHGGQQSTKGTYPNSAAYLNAGPNASQQTQQSHREFGRDISNIAHTMVSSSQNLNQSMHQKEPAKGSSSIGGTNRVPQPSIIDSATGRMSQGGHAHSNRGGMHMDQENSYAYLQQQQQKGRPSQQQNLNNPMIIDKKYSLNAASRQSFNVSMQNSNQASHRYLLKDNFTSSQGPSNGASQQTRKSSYSNSNSMGQNNVFKRLRQTGPAGGSGSQTSTTAHGGRYHPSGPSTSHGMRNIQIDKRLNELKSGNPSNQSHGSFVMNKYSNHHQMAHDHNMKSQGAGMTSTINKSGQNLNGNFAKTTKSHIAPQTQRNGGVHTQNTASSVLGSATGRSSMNKQIINGLMQPAVVQGMPQSTLTHHSSMAKGGAPKAESNERAYDKENRQRLSNKASSSSGKSIDVKGSRASEPHQRSSGQSSKPGQTIQTTVNGSSNHTKSKNSEMEVCSSSHGTMSQRNSSSQHHTNRSNKGLPASKAGPAQQYHQAKPMTQMELPAEPLLGLKKDEESRHEEAQNRSIVSQGLANGFATKQSDHEMKEVPTSGFLPSQPVRAVQSNPQSMVTSAQTSKQGPPLSAKMRDSQKKEKASFDEDRLNEVTQTMEARRKEWLKKYKTKMDLNDVLELRNPQSVIEFIPEIVTNMRLEEERHLYPPNFLQDRTYQSEITDKYRQYLVDWLAELHYKFKMWAETLYVMVGIIDKTLIHWKDFKKADLQLLGITALHIAGKYEEIYPPELKTILEVIENAVSREKVVKLESKILQILDFDMTWPSILRFMERYACIATFNSEQLMIAQMFCDFMLLNMPLLQQRPSVLGAVAIYATNRITNKNKPWNAALAKCTGGIKEEQLKPLANELFYFIKKIKGSSLKTMTRKYQQKNYLEVEKVLDKIEWPKTHQKQGEDQAHLVQEQNAKMED